VKCLVLESSPGIRRAVVRALRAARPDAVPVCLDPREAMATIDDSVALVVLGWPADDESALARLRELRACPGSSATPVVVVSPRGSREDVNAAAAAGATEYVVRPFDGEALAERLARHLPAPESLEPGQAAA